MLFASLPSWAEQFVFTTSWTAQAQFAGYYIAKEKGFYRAEGLDVVIQHPSLTTSLLQRLQDEKSDGVMLTLMTAIDLTSQGIPKGVFWNSIPTSMDAALLWSRIFSRGWENISLPIHQIMMGISKRNRRVTTTTVISSSYGIKSR
jgi:hypothetical protein